MIYGSKDYNTSRIELSKGKKLLEIDLASGWCIGQIEFDERKNTEDIDEIKVRFIKRKEK